ncbi:MAG TPA: N-acetylmuramoyl-L-alanine amidase [Stellaceae bacterium]|nr:N-acetylmuramoyl-L-alanine amidase [Stellaceae bacterium]
MTPRERQSPNFNARLVGAPIDMLVLHYTGMRTAEEAIDRLCDPAAKVSAHYVIDEDGTVWRLVAEENRAWHAGISSWQGTTDVNGASIGIELVNPGHEWGYRDFPEVQMAALEALARGILGRHPIPGDRVVGHSDVAPLRKQDPGERFDWRRLARAGVGIWPENGTVLSPHTIAEMQMALVQIGYGVSRSEVLDEDTRAALTAFQRHFRPARCDGVLDDESAARIAAVARAVGALRRAR